MQSSPFDPRIVKVSIEVNGLLKTYDGFSIYASGTKFANANQNECEIKIFNLDKATRDYILTETSPFNLNRTPKRAIVEAGRQSYGTTKIYSGNIVSSVASQPPDIGITLKCLTGNFLKGNIVARYHSAQTPLDVIAKQISSDLSTTLDFQAANKNVSNFNFSGSSLKQVDALNAMGDVNAFIDNDVLVVKNVNQPIPNRTRVLNMDSGMIGIPEITEQGLKVKFLLDNITTLGGMLRVQSVSNPATNGDYVIYKLGFEIASRDTPFYWIAEGKRMI